MRQRPGHKPGYLLALILSRAAAGLGGALCGIGLVHLVMADNPWGAPVLAGGLVLLLHGIYWGARLSGHDSGGKH